MIFEFLRKFAGSGGRAEPVVEESVVYNGYTIQPAPRKDDGGWRIHGVICKEIDTVRKQHTYIRADTYTGKDDAIAATISKGKRIIDEQGDAMFRD